MDILSDPAAWLREILLNAGLSDRFSAFILAVVLVAVVLILAYVTNLIAKFFIVKVVHRIIRRTEWTWDDVFVEHKVFSRLSHLVPAFVIWAMAEWALADYEKWNIAVQKISYIYVLSLGAIVINSVIESWHKIYLMLPIAEHRHIKGYVQLVKILIYIIIILLIISVVFKQNVTSLVVGLGGMAAVLLLIFRDTILGFVSSIQLSANHMVKIGDWITIPGRGVDGDVIDMTLYTIKVRNFDMTILTVPTYALMQESFQNWTGMQESGGRRIKRAMRIEMKSIKFLDEELKNKLYRIQILKPYIDAKEAEIKKYNEVNGIDDSCLVNGRRMTNVGTFRAYAQAYLSSHPKVNTDMTFMVRHLPPDEKGLPLEIYVFCKHKEWVAFESVQSDIFDHLLAVIPEFGLRLFEFPTGDDRVARTSDELSE